MARRFLIGSLAALWLAGGLSAVVMLGRARPAAAQGRGGGAPVVPGQYIVVFKDGVSNPAQAAAQIAQQQGLRLGAVFERAIKGFSAFIPEIRLGNVKNDARVQYLEQDRVVRAVAQTLPTGIDRVNAEKSPTAKINGTDGPDQRVDADIAIIDTGIQTNHPDLNVKGGKNCTYWFGFDDQNGHGTHVAGTAAALDNGSGVVGVAPGARLWAVRVLGPSGSGYLSWIIAGIDWVTATRTDSDPANDIDVANMSLGFEGSSQALDSAISRSVDAGVTYVVAAGNNGRNLDDAGFTFSPAEHSKVITVGAIADSDGKCGGAGAATSNGNDDTFAAFSNYGSALDLAAPGVNILSTWRRSGTSTLSGTSMAAPHVAGAAALVKAKFPAYTPAQVKDALLQMAVPQVDACDGNNQRGGFTANSSNGHLAVVPLVDAGGL